MTERMDPMRDASDGPAIPEESMKYFIDADGFTVEAPDGKLDPLIEGSEKAWTLPDGRAIRKTAFSKSIAEAVAAGKIPTEFRETSGMIFQIVKATEKEVTEARVTMVVAAVQKATEERPVKTDSPSPDDGRTRRVTMNALRKEALALQARVLKLGL